jgi:hypothetical protein
MLYKGNDKDKGTRLCLFFNNDLNCLIKFKHFYIEKISYLRYYFSEYMLSIIKYREELGSSDALNATDENR